MRLRLIAVTILLAVLSGCTTPSFTMPPGSKSYRTGYSDGCGAGYSVAGSLFYKYRESVEPPPKGHPQRVGWLAGFNRCKINYQRIQKVVNAVFGPP